MIAGACLSGAALLGRFVGQRELTIGLLFLVVLDVILVFGTSQVTQTTTTLHGITPAMAGAKPLPALQDVTLGSSMMGWLDLLAPALLGLILARSPRRLATAGAVTISALLWGTLLYATPMIPATVPVLAGLAVAYRCPNRRRVGLTIGPAADRPEGHAPTVDANPGRARLVAVIEHEIANPQRGLRRQLGIVLMRPSAARNKRHAIPHVRLDHAAVLLDGISHPAQTLSDEDLDLLGRQPLAQRGRANDVGEEKCDRPDLVLARCHRSHDLTYRSGVAELNTAPTRRISQNVSPNSVSRLDSSPGASVPIQSSPRWRPTGTHDVEAPRRTEQPYGAIGANRAPGT
jgi:hypothetical protein